MKMESRTTTTTTKQHKPYNLCCVKRAISEKIRENEVQNSIREN
jgi:hypothetical protein